jgi:hypothetical protein
MCEGSATQAKECNHQKYKSISHAPPRERNFAAINLIQRI